MVVRNHPSQIEWNPEPRVILVALPNWVGDVVMATAALHAIRARFPAAHIVHLMRRYVADVLRGTGFCDEQVYWPSKSEPQKAGGYPGLIRQLRRSRFDAAALLTNSFRSALIARLAGARRRIGYSRDARGWLLTDRLKPPRRAGRFVPIPALDYYNDLARAMGCRAVEDRLRLATTAEDEAAIDRRLGRADVDRPLVVLNAGANYGSAKCWPAEKYAVLSDEIVARYGARVVASFGPKEHDIAQRLAAAALRPIDILIDPPLGLGPLRALIRRCRLLITNDTGPRHFAAAFGVPVVTIFGSSDPAWTETRYERERIVKLDLDCQPCMARVCPLKHHDCMRHLEPSAVMQKVEACLAPGRRASASTDNRLNLGPAKPVAPPSGP